MIDLIVQYRNAKRKINNINIDPYNMYVDEARVVGEMMSDINYALEWMRTGNQPNVKLQGTATKSIYTKRLLLNTNLFPCLDLETHEQEQQLSDHKKKVIRFILSELSDRQLTCFLLHVAHMRTYAEIGEELGIKASTVQNHIERAREKIDGILKQNVFEI